MISKPLARIAFILAVIAISTTKAGAWPHKHGQKARVRFVATSTLIRGTFGQNEDTYLAQVFTARGDESYFIRLVDAYPNDAPFLSMVTLTSDSGTLLRIQRVPQCDRIFGEMLLRAAPGDPIAIMAERMVYHPHLDAVPAKETMLPCYRVVWR